jgi:hypothetical protein
MRAFNTKAKCILLIIFSVPCLTSCKENVDDPKEADRMKAQMMIIDSLLKDISFAESMAKTLDSSYYAGIGEQAPAFLSPSDDTAIIIKSLRDEKVAMKLAGFYALECGIGLLCTQTNTKPVEWLKKITGGSADSSAVLLLNRFANATWKAGQPFRELNRITRPVFSVASSLSPEEVDKDYFQIYYSAKKLLSDMDRISDSSMPEQMQMLRGLLQDTLYAVNVAAFLDSSGTRGERSESPFLTPTDDTATIRKSVKEMKIATSLAGFYAVECAANYLATKNKELPSTVLKSFVNNSMNEADKLIFARFANATWKAGQPFRDLKRITRATFTPFYFLTEADIEKDIVQVRAAAARLLNYL